MTVDSHVHLYPPSVYGDPRKWAIARGEPYWLSCVAPKRGRSLQAWATVSDILSHMDAAGVDKVVLQAWYWETHDSCEENLHWQIEWIKAHPDRFIGFAPFNARGGQRALDSLRLAFDVGFRGIGELNPPAQNYAYDDPFLQQALQLAAQAQAAVTFHVTDPDSRDYPGKIDTPIESLQALARAHPKTRFVFAHLGGLAPLGPDFRQADNVWYDTAAAPLLYDATVYRRFCDAVGAERLLFGTDYPLRVFPRQEASPDFATALQQLRHAGLADSELRKILSSNAIALLQP